MHVERYSFSFCSSGGVEKEGGSAGGGVTPSSTEKQGQSFRKNLIVEFLDSFMTGEGLDVGPKWGRLGSPSAETAKMAIFFLTL